VSALLSYFYHASIRLQRKPESGDFSHCLSLVWLTRALADSALADLRAPLEGLLRLHYRHRFDAHGLSGPEREALGREAKLCLGALSRRERHPTRPA